MELWHSYINWEKGNPLKVEDPALVARRVRFHLMDVLLEHVLSSHMMRVFTVQICK